MITLSDESHITPTLTFNGNTYFRQLWPSACRRKHQQLLPLHPAGTQRYLCNGGDRWRRPILQPARRGSPMGEIDRNWTHSLSTGATAQFTDTDKIFGHDNTITGGVSIDHGWTTLRRQQPIGPPAGLCRSKVIQCTLSMTPRMTFRPSTSTPKHLSRRLRPRQFRHHRQIGPACRRTLQRRRSPLSDQTGQNPGSQFQRKTFQPDQPGRRPDL